MKFSLVWSLSGTLLLGACANASPTGTPPRLTPESTPLPASQASAPSPLAPRETPARLPDSVVITFQRSGGFAGVDEEWKIFADGRIESNTGEQLQATPDQVRDLLAKIEALGFFQLKESFLPPDTCCDRFTYTLTVQAGDRAHSVTVLEASPGVPQAFWDAVQSVSQLIK